MTASLTSSLRDAFERVRRDVAGSAGVPLSTTTHSVSESGSWELTDALRAWSLESEPGSLEVVDGPPWA